MYWDDNTQTARWWIRLKLKVLKIKLLWRVLLCVFSFLVTYKYDAFDTFWLEKKDCVFFRENCLVGVHVVTSVNTILVPNQVSASHQSLFCSCLRWRPLHVLRKDVFLLPFLFAANRQSPKWRLPKKEKNKPESVSWMFRWLGGIVIKVLVKM